jgi:hypothetical protein
MLSVRAESSGLVALPDNDSHSSPSFHVPLWTKPEPALSMGSPHPQMEHAYRGTHPNTDKKIAAAIMKDFMVSPEKERKTPEIPESLGSQEINQEQGWVVQGVQSGRKSANNFHVQCHRKIHTRFAQEPNEAAKTGGLSIPPCRGNSRPSSMAWNRRPVPPPPVGPSSW